MREIGFFAGVVSMNPSEEVFAYEIGRLIGLRGWTMLHGGYNGLMEAAARGCREHGGRVIAVGLADVEWGEFNSFIDEAIVAQTTGDRLERFTQADGIIAYAGGIGTLFEIAGAAHTFLFRPPRKMLFAGERALRLLDFMVADGWILKRPTRDFSFMSRAVTALDVEQWLSTI
jgi:uncharacterized protein (TIGR00725 family)